MQSEFSPTYFYYFRFATKTGIVTTMKKNSKYYQLATQDDFLGISHGDDVFLIYLNPGSRISTRDLNEIPYSDDEKAVSRQLINLYKNFASFNLAMYENLTIEGVQSSNVTCLEIFSPQNFSLTLKDKEFGNQKFWNDLMINDN